MKVSDVTRSAACDFCRIIESDLTTLEGATIDAMIEAAKQYCIGYTGLTASELDEHEDITIAMLVLVGDMYDNRQMYVDKANVNRTAETILGMHCVNWIPEEIVRETTETETTETETTETETTEATEGE